MAKQSSGSRGRPKPVDAAVVDEYWCPDGFQEEYDLTETDLALCNRRLHDPLALDPRRVLSYFGADVRPDWEVDEAEQENGDLLYGLDKSGRLLFLTVRDAFDLTQTRLASWQSDAWGRFWDWLPNRQRSFLEPRLNGKLLEGSLAFMAREHDLYGSFAALVFRDVEWSAFARERMVELIPADLQRRYGVLHDSGFYTRSLELDPDLMEELVEDLQASGFRCHRNDLFVALACG